MQALWQLLNRQWVIKIPYWLLAAVPLLGYAAWEGYWYTRVGLCMVKWHTHLAVYVYLWVAGLAAYIWRWRKSPAPGRGNWFVAFSAVVFMLGLFELVLIVWGRQKTYLEQITGAYGTELVFSSELEGSDGAIRLVREIVAREPDRYFYPDQYSNESNPRAHYLGTGAELLAALGSRLTHFVTGIGTSGTVMGTGRRLKEHRRPDGSQIRVIAVEPDDAFHGLEGLKHMASSLVPAIWRPEQCVDEVLPMSTDAGWEMTEMLKEAEGLFVGHSAGANVAAAIQVARQLAARGQTGCVATVLCDRGDRYFVPLKWERRYEW